MLRLYQLLGSNYDRSLTLPHSFPRIEDSV
jgi:hypothetical protein